MYDIATGLVLLCHAMLYHVISHTMSKGRIWKGGGVDWMASHPSFGEAKHKKFGNGCEYFMEEIKTNPLDRWLIVISTL